MIVKMVARETRRNFSFFSICFVIMLICSVVAFMGMRIIDSASLIVHGSPYYDLRNMLLLEGWFMLLSGMTFCCLNLTLSYLSLPSQYKQNLNILRKLGTGKDQFMLIFLFQTIVIAFPAVLCSLFIGEALIRTHMEFFFGVRISLGGIFNSVYPILLLFLLAFILVCAIISSAYFKEKSKRDKKNTFVLFPLKELCRYRFPSEK